MAAIVLVIILKVEKENFTYPASYVSNCFSSDGILVGGKQDIQDIQDIP